MKKALIVIGLVGLVYFTGKASSAEDYQTKKIGQNLIGAGISTLITLIGSFKYTKSIK